MIYSLTVIKQFPLREFSVSAVWLYPNLRQMKLGANSRGVMNRDDGRCCEHSAIEMNTAKERVKKKQPRA